jgi:hypothetical protein
MKMLEPVRTVRGGEGQASTADGTNRNTTRGGRTQIPALEDHPDKPRRLDSTSYSRWSADALGRGMGVWRAALCVAAMAWAGACSAHSASGAYLNQGRGFVELLQITVKADGSFEGTLTHAVLKTNGSLSQDNTPLTGVVDGHSITVVLKAPLPFLSSSSLSGTLDGGAIALTLPKGMARYTESNPAAYQAALQQMSVQGAAIQKQQQAEAAEATRQRQINDENAAVAMLNKRLADYAAMVQAPRNARLLDSFHTTHKSALAKARHALEAQQKYPRHSVQASQVSVAISQIEVNLQVYDTSWGNLPEQGRSHLRELDAAIARSPCNRPGTQLSSCMAQPEAIRMYQAVKPMVERRSADIEATLKADDAAMAAIVKQADDYAR